MLINLLHVECGLHLSYFSPDLCAADVLVTRAQGCHMHTLTAGHFTEHFHEYIFVFDLFALFIISGGSLQFQ